VPSSVIFGFSLLFVFLILAALYESWSLPFSVLLSTPVTVFGAFGMLWLRRLLIGEFLPAYMVQIENDVYACVSLWTASGAGSVARQIMGTTVIGGMTAATVLGIFCVSDSLFSC
jgi:multidrug efflux pump subunit AcrB